MRKTTSSAVLAAVGLVVVFMVVWGAAPQAADTSPPSRALKSITINTQAYAVPGKRVDRRSLSITADEDMHIVGVEHFTGVQGGAWSDNGHMLSLLPKNPWEQWAEAGTGMEPTGQKGYFGYSGRDYYREVGGIGDVTQYEMFPDGTHVLVPAGKKLYLHCYANNFSEPPKMFHHTVRLLYW